MKLNRILVATDLSSTADAAITQGLALARSHGAKLVLLHACEVPEAAVGVPPSMALHARFYEDVLRERLAVARDALERQRERISGQGVTVSHLVREGFADSVIVDTAEEMAVDLIVVGSHGRQGASRVFLGSVAERVVRTATMPVLVARGDERAAGGYHDVTAAVDFTEASDGVLEAALAMVATGGRVEVVHSWEVLGPALGGLTPASVVDEFMRSARQAASAATVGQGAGLLARHHREGVTVSFRALEGRAGSTVVDAATHAKASLLVTGSHGRRGIRRWILGSVAEHIVRHAPCSVLVIHAAPRL